MKRRKISGITVLLFLCCMLCGCAAAAGGQTTAEETPVLWPETEMPAALKYDRMWIYSAQAETEDPEVIRDIVEAVRNYESVQELNLDAEMKALESSFLLLKSKLEELL